MVIMHLKELCLLKHDDICIKNNNALIKHHIFGKKLWHFVKFYFALINYGFALRYVINTASNRLPLAVAIVFGAK